MYPKTEAELYESEVATNQSLTFATAETFFAKRNQPFGDAQKRTLNLIDAEGRYTNLALLLSDQCEHTIKFASFQGTTKSIFKNRKEFTGSIFKQIEDCLQTIDQYNQIRSEFGYMDRIDRRDYSIEALREALFNCVVHRDYSLSGPILVSVFDDRIEMVNLGGLVKGINYGDLGMGVSQLRNKNLACIFYRLTLIESYGTGIPKINEAYDKYGLKAHIDVSDNAFKITLPNVNYQNGILDSKVREASVYYRSPVSDKQSKIEQLFAHRNSASRSEIQNELGISQAGAILLIRDYLERGILEKENTGRYTRYKLLTRSIPFEVKLNPTSNEKKISQHRVEDLKALLAKVPESVEEIWVFGSTVTEHCRPQSDLDVCIIGHTTTKEESAMYKAPKCAVDIITETPEGFAKQSKINGSIYKEVIEKGVLVYKKGEKIEWE